MKYGKMIVLTLVITLLVGAFAANAQTREVIIENTGLPNCIKEALEADLAANDSATVTNTKYILRRGETYVHTEQYQPSHGVWLEAEEGEGALPRILPISSGGEAPRLIRASNNMTYIGLDYEGLDSDGNHTDNAPLRMRGNYTTFIAKDCIFADHRHEVARVDGGHQTWLVENNIFVRNYRKTDWDFGYTFSLRNQQIESMIIKDNTFLNSTGGMFHSDNQGGCKYMEFSNNTCYGLGGLYRDFIYVNQFEAAMVNFGPAQNIKCTDNILVDCMMFGYQPHWADSLSIINVDLTDSTGTVEVSNNNIYRDPDFLALNPDSVEVIKWFDPELQSLIGEDGADFGFISEDLDFTNVPSLDMLKYAVTEYWKSPTAKLDIFLELATEPADEDLDLSYSTAALSATASTTGGPLGSSAWMASTPVDDVNVVSANAFALQGNYPNPFNPTTTIRFDLAQQAKVSVTVYNLTGQVVHEIPAQAMNAGKNQSVKINAANWATGTYLYQVTADVHGAKHVSTGRMLLLK